MVDFCDFMARYRLWSTQQNSAELSAFSRVLSSFLDGFSEVAIDEQPLRLTVRKGDARLSLQQLSDGERAFIAMLGDLVRRLALANPESSKGDTPIVLANYYWPDVDNTLRAFQYSTGGLVDPSPTLSSAQQRVAQDSIALVGLDRYPGGSAGEPSTADLRWLRRQEAWALAQECVARRPSEVRELIVEVATGRGMFSIWWTAFAGDADMRRRLRQAFFGTCPNSFDANENLQL